MGDPCGIGPEIVVKLLADPDCPKVPLVVIGDCSVLKCTATRLGIALDIVKVGRSESSFVRDPSTIAILQLGDSLPNDLPVGKVDARAGAAAYDWVSIAANLAIAGDVSAVVTAPINKAAMAAAGVRFPGHTEIFAYHAGGADVGMMLANDELRVMLVSIHLSLADAIAAVTHESEIRAIRLAHAACQSFGIVSPRVAVAGLNPHAGEGGLFGDEEINIIAPAIALARAEGIDASGPWPGDTIFMCARRGDFDVVVAQYHDQGLIPVKYLGVDQGVNITVGLPFVRTSVDHGTAFDIAGKGQANPASIAYALKQAIAMTNA